MRKGGGERKHGSESAGKTDKVSKKDIEHVLIKNIVELQKVHTHLAEKFDKLANEISQLLALFELTARTFVKNAPQTPDFEKDKEFLEKIDKLLEQNKVLAKGLTLMEERLREKMYFSPKPTQKEDKQRTPNDETGEFQPSMTSTSRPLPRF